MCWYLLSLWVEEVSASFPVFNWGHNIIIIVILSEVGKGLTVEVSQEVLLVRGVLLLELPFMPPFPEYWQGVWLLQNLSSILSWCNISLFLSFCLLFSLVPTCSRLKIPNHQPSQQGLSSRASHSGALYSRSVSDMVLQAFGFHPCGKGTCLITFALYRQTPVSGNVGLESDVPALGLSVSWCRCCGLISCSHLQTQLDAVVPLLCLQCSLPVIWAARFILEAFIFKLYSSVFWVREIASCVPQLHDLFCVLLSLSVSPDLTVANIKALILMALWLTGAHFPYYLRLFLLNLTVISIIDIHYNFQNCPLLGLWLCFFPFLSVNSSLLMFSQILV